MAMGTGSKLALGCGCLVLLGATAVVGVVGMGAWWAKRKVAEATGGLERMTARTDEVDRWERKANANAYTPPADRVIPEERFLKFFESAETRASVCGAATKCGERVVVPDVEESPLFAGTESLAVLRGAGVRAVQSTPMMSRGGKLLGILTTQWDRPYSPDEHDLWRMDLLARQAADLVEQLGMVFDAERQVAIGQHHAAAVTDVARGELVRHARPAVGRLQRLALSM